MQEDWPIWADCEKVQVPLRIGNNSEIDEGSIKLIILYYKGDHKLVNEHYQFKEYFHLRKS